MTKQYLSGKLIIIKTSFVLELMTLYNIMLLS